MIYLRYVNRNPILQKCDLCLFLMNSIQKALNRIVRLLCYSEFIHCICVISERSNNINTVDRPLSLVSIINVVFLVHSEVSVRFDWFSHSQINAYHSKIQLTQETEIKHLLQFWSIFIIIYAIRVMYGVAYAWGDVFEWLTSSMYSSKKITSTMATRVRL